MRFNPCISKGERVYQSPKSIKTIHQGGHVASSQGFKEIPERLCVVDPVGSWSSIQEESRPLISQGRDFSISSSGKIEGRVS
jgi:hypothetical protein